MNLLFNFNLTLLKTSKNIETVKNYVVFKNLWNSLVVSYVLKLRFTGSIFTKPSYFRWLAGVHYESNFPVGIAGS